MGVPLVWVTSVACRAGRLPLAPGLCGRALKRAGAVALAAFTFAAPAASQLTPTAYIAASRLIGAQWDDVVENMVRAPDGKLYLYGRQGSTFAPGLPSSRLTNAGQFGAFVARIDPLTLAADWVTIVGRQRSKLIALDLQDRVDGFAVGSDGYVYVAAYASSVRFPETGGIYTGWSGAKYIYRVDSQGNVTPFAGPLDAAIRSIRALAVDAQGNVFFSGRAAATMATTANAFVAGPQVAAVADSGPYLVKIDAATRNPAFATFLTIPRSRTATPADQTCREPFPDALTTAYAIGAASDGSVYVAGQADPGDLAVTTGAADTLDKQYRDAFVARVSSTGTTMLFVARFGGRDNDRATSLIVGSDGNVTVGGKWLDKGGVWYGPRGGFQSLVGHQWSFSNICEPTVPTEAGFLLRVSPSGAQLGATSMIGAVGGDLAGWMARPDPMPVRLAADGAGNVYITGTTDSGQTLPTRFPFVPDAALYQFSVRPTHAFLMKVRLSDFSLLYGSRFGSRDSDAGAMAVAVDAFGNAFVAGNAPVAESFPMVNAPVFGRPFRFSSAFVTRVHESFVDLVLTANPAQPLAGTPVQLTATLGDRQYTGNVEFRDRGTLVGTAPLVGGVAQLSVSLAAGIYELSAIVRGSGVWNGNTTAPQRVVVQQTSATQ